MQQFDVSPIPSTKETEQLFSDLLAQDKWMEEHSGYEWKKNTFAKIVEADVAQVSTSRVAASKNPLTIRSSHCASANTSPMATTPTS